MSPIFILARMTFVQAIRRRIVLTGLLLGLCFLVVFSIGFHMILGIPVAPPNPGEVTGIQHIVEAEKSSVSAPSRLAASAKLFRVRVEFSKNRLTQVLPASSGTFR